MKEPNKTKIALVNPPLNIRHPQLPPLGLMYLAAILDQNGYEIKIMECPVNKITHEQLKAELSSFAPDLIGISSITPTVNSALQSARIAKEACPNAKVIMGGPHTTFLDKELLSQEAAVDIIVRGEGEKTLLELTQHLLNSEKLGDINGITFRNGNGQIVKTPDRPFIQNLDELPRPAYKFVPLQKYKVYGKLDLPIMTSRGCPYQCSFCVASQMFGGEYRVRSPKNVVDEMIWLRDEQEAEGISFCDDILTLDRNRTLDLCEEIKSRKVGLPWGCQTRVDHVPKDVLVKMREANCQLIHFGVESGCQKILDDVRKRISPSQCFTAIKEAKEQGIFAAVTAIIGYPGETRETVKQTLDLIRKLEPDDAWLCTATPYPGTELRALVERNGWKMCDDWSQYNMATPVFENPDLPSEELVITRRKFYAKMYSPRYVFRQTVKGYFKGNFYSQIMARTAVNHMLWRFMSRF